MQLFLATAMEAQAPSELQTVLQLRRLLNGRFGNDSVFLAAHEFPTPDTYLTPAASLVLVTEEIRKADVFVLFFAARVCTGALVELGIALTLGKPTLALAPSLNLLPYMCREGGPNFDVACADPLDAKAAYAGILRFITSFVPDNRCSALHGEPPPRSH